MSDGLYYDPEFGWCGPHEPESNDPVDGDEQDRRWTEGLRQLKSRARLTDEEPRFPRFSERWTDWGWPSQVARPVPTDDATQGDSAPASDAS